MSYPPPPGLRQNSTTSSSLPARPPPSTNTNSSNRQGGYGGSGSGYNAFTAFAPRSVAASQQPHRTNSPVVSAPPVPPSGFSAPSSNYGDYYQQPQSYQGGGQQYYGQQGQQYGDNAYAPAVPHIQNPFGEDGPYARGKMPVDPETEAQIAQWQSAYASKDDSWRSSARQTSGASTPSTYAVSHTQSGRAEAAPKTVARAGGGQNWTDPTLLEWDPAHFRLFVGNLAGEVTDDSLFKAFAKYASVQKARVIRDKRTQKSRGYGFVSFSDGDDYFKAAREMQGKYIGSHPILLRRATTEVRPVSTANAKGKKGGGGGGGNKGSGKVKQDGVKKPGKTKGGLKILG